MKAMAWRGAAILLAVLLAMSAGALAEGGESAYTLNEWNYVDQSMDVSGGIPGDAEGLLWIIGQTGVLRVATEPYFPPQEFIDPDREGQERFVGSDMELAKRIAQRMGVALQIVPMDFSEVLPAVQEGKCDLAITALSFTPGRAAQVTMSKGYFYAEAGAGSAMLIRAEDAGEIAGIEDLKGRNIAAQAGSIQEALTAEHVQRYHEFRRLPQVQDLYDQLEAGDVDAAMVDAETARLYIESNPDCGLMLVPGVRFALEGQFAGDRIAARKGELQLIAFVNGVIDEVLESGEYVQWYAEAAELAAELGL